MILGRVLSLAAAGYRILHSFIPVVGAATWHPADKNADFTLSNGDRTATKTSGGQGDATLRGTLPKTTGKWYIEVTNTVATNYGQTGDGLFVIALSTTALNQAPGIGTTGVLLNHDFIYLGAGFSAPSGTSLSYSGQGTSTYMLAFDLDNRRMWLGKNNTWVFSGNPVTNTNPTVTWAGVTDPIYLGQYTYFQSDSSTLNTGQEAFVNSVPAGFNAGWYSNTTIGETWFYYPSNQFDSSDAYSLAWNGSTFVVGLSAGYVGTSSNGTSWTVRTSLRDGTWSVSRIVRTLVWNPTSSLFVAGGSTGGIATSSDGITWTWQANLSSGTWSTGEVTDLNWNGTRYVAVGTAARVATSTNATSWTYQSQLASTTWGNSTACRAIAWNGSIYVVLGDTGRCATSSDGATWTYQSQLSGTAWGTSVFPTDVTWNGTIFCAVGTNGAVATSSDGATWTYQSQLASTGWSTTTIRSIVWADSRFVILGDSGKVATSADGVTWSYETSLSSTGWATKAGRALLWTGSTVLAAGDNDGAGNTAFAISS